MSAKPCTVISCHVVHSSAAVCLLIFFHHFFPSFEFLTFLWCVCVTRRCCNRLWNHTLSLDVHLLWANCVVAHVRIINFRISTAFLGWISSYHQTPTKCSSAIFLVFANVAERGKNWNLGLENGSDNLFCVQIFTLPSNTSTTAVQL